MGGAPFPKRWQAGFGVMERNRRKSSSAATDRLADGAGTDGYAHSLRDGVAQAAVRLPRRRAWRPFGGSPGTGGDDTRNPSC
ncbi:hypothetical protein nbrc107696_19000 [Gordonia spumicola]|uniref:Uncharacterized protein n=1 Tax=Gordonia spumicola TaxID=589161 RepID=A0A7I9V8A1_9ACTN|nr:hypothetical protein nbrc107696_19000 [Gordonia spumicola]